MLTRTYVGIINMSFFEAVGKCYRKYFVFKGRAPKSEFWWFFLLLFLFAWPLFLAELETGSWAGFLSLIYFLLTMSAVFPYLAVFVRRLHDVGKSAWNILFMFIPAIGAIVILRWLMKHGDPESNKYGEPDNLPFRKKVKAPTGVEE